MSGELLAQQGQVVLFQGRGGEGRVGVEEAVELGDDIFSLGGGGCQSNDAAWYLNVRLTFSRRSSSLASVVLSSSVGFCGMFGAVENCE